MERESEGSGGGGGRVLTQIRDGVIMDCYRQKYGLNLGSNLGDHENVYIDSFITG